MTKLKKKYEAGHGYSREDWDTVSDNPPLTDEQLAKGRSFAEAFPALAESIKRGRGRPAVEYPKKQVTLRLDADLLDRLRESGPGWQGRVNDALRKMML